MKTSIIYKSALCIICLTILAGCKKFLEEKQNKNQVIPNTLQDAQAVLDYPRTFQNDNFLGIAWGDDYYVSEARFQALPEHSRGMYTFQRTNLYQNLSNDWQSTYERAYIANTSLETLEKIDPSSVNQDEYNNIKGQALFLRARVFLTALHSFANIYRAETAESDLGIALRLNTNFNEPTVRLPVSECYDRVIADISESATLLQPVQVAVTRPGKAAALGLLARTYHSMRQYERSAEFAKLCIDQTSAKLLDYNGLTASAAFPIHQFNSEVIQEGRVSTPTLLINASVLSPKSIYDLYETNDLRKTIFFRINNDGTIGYKGSYTGGTAYFTGLALDEIYLIRAESLARTGKTAEAMTELNTLLSFRYKRDPVTKVSTYINQTAASPADAVSKILLERRRQLIHRGTRLYDIKKQNAEGAGIDITRNINGSAYVVKANSSGFIAPIPENIIQLSGIPQN